MCLAGVETRRVAVPGVACFLPAKLQSARKVMTDPNTYESPLAARNASREMLALFSPQHKFGLWRRLWLELARCQRELGLARITDEALQQMAAKLDDIDFAA